MPSHLDTVPRKTQFFRKVETVFIFCQEIFLLHLRTENLVQEIGCPQAVREMLSLGRLVNVFLRAELKGKRQWGGEKSPGTFSLESRLSWSFVPANFMHHFAMSLQVQSPLFPYSYDDLIIIAFPLTNLDSCELEHSWWSPTPIISVSQVGPETSGAKRFAQDGTDRIPI